MAVLIVPIALILAAGPASAHGAADTGVFQRYDELFGIAGIAFILTLAVGAILLFGPLKQRKADTPARPSRRDARAGKRARLSPRSR